MVTEQPYYDDIDELENDMSDETNRTNMPPWKGTPPSNPAAKSERTFMLHIQLIEQVGGTRVGMPVWEQVMPITVSLTPDNPELHTVRTADLVRELNTRYGDMEEISDGSTHRTKV